MQDGAAQNQQLAYARVGDTIVNLLAFAPGLDEPTPAQAPQMGGDAALRRLDGGHSLAHAALTRRCVGQRLQEANAGGVAQGAQHRGCVRHGLP